MRYGVSSVQIYGQWFFRETRMILARFYSCWIWSPRTTIGDLRPAWHWYTFNRWDTFAQRSSAHATCFRKNNSFIYPTYINSIADIRCRRCDDATFVSVAAASLSTIHGFFSATPREACSSFTVHKIPDLDRVARAIVNPSARIPGNQNIIILYIVFFYSRVVD